MDSHFYEGRLSVLGHVQRGGSPLIFDRLLATRSAELATNALLEGKSGFVAGLSVGEYQLVPHEIATQQIDKVTPQLRDLAKLLSV